MNTSTHDPVAVGVGRVRGVLQSARCTVDAAERSPAPDVVVRETELVYEL